MSNHHLKWEWDLLSQLKAVNKSLILEEGVNNDLSILHNEFNIERPNVKFKAANGKRGKYVRKLKKKRGAERPHPDYIFCENEEVLDKEENTIIFEESEPNKALPQYQRPLFINKKHNLSKVEEEDFDDTFYV